MNEEVTRLLNVLRTAMKVLGVTNREVEKKLELSYGYLSRLFAGSIDLKMDHILDICQAVGLQPAEFFHLAYPRPPVPGTPAAARLRDVLQGFQPPATVAETPSGGISREEVERMMEDSLKKLLAELDRAREVS